MIAWTRSCRERVINAMAFPYWTATTTTDYGPISILAPKYCLLWFIIIMLFLQAQILIIWLVFSSRYVIYRHSPSSDRFIVVRVDACPKLFLASKCVYACMFANIQSMCSIKRKDLHLHADSSALASAPCAYTHVEDHLANISGNT